MWQLRGREQGCILSPGQRLKAVLSEARESQEEEESVDVIVLVMAEYSV